MDVETLFVGDGPEREKLESIARELKVLEHCTFMGARPNAEMPGLLSSASAAIFPSLMVATSVAALEAMSCEVPVAASNVGGLPDLVPHGKCGLVCAPQPHAIAEAILKFYELGEGFFIPHIKAEREKYSWANLVNAIKNMAATIV